MTRTLIMLSLALLLAGASFFLLSNDGKDGPARVSQAGTDRQFAYENTEDIYRILVADRRNNSVTLTRGGITGWLVDGKYPANENVMKNLLDAVERIDIRTLPARAAVPVLVRGLATSGILVQLFNREGEKLRGYYIGGGVQGELGTSAIVEGSENPYIVHLQNFTGNLRARFNHRGDEWRSKVVLRSDPDRVELLSVDYPLQQGRSFVLTREGEGYVLRNPYRGAESQREVARGVAEGILSRFEELYVSRFENQDEEFRPLAAQAPPFASIRLREAGGTEQTLEVHPSYRRGYTTDTKSGEIIDLSGVSAYRGFANDGRDWVLFSDNTLEPLFVTYESF